MRLPTLDSREPKERKLANHMGAEAVRETPRVGTGGDENKPGEARKAKK